MIIYLLGNSEGLCLMCETINTYEFASVFNITDCFPTSEFPCLPVTYYAFILSILFLSTFCVPSSVFFFLISLLFLISLAYNKGESTRKKLRKNKVEGMGQFYYLLTNIKFCQLYHVCKLNERLHGIKKCFTGLGKIHNE